jgi:hypothetical protein
LPPRYFLFLRRQFFKLSLSTMESLLENASFPLKNCRPFETGNSFFAHRKSWTNRTWSVDFTEMFSGEIGEQVTRILLQRKFITSAIHEEEHKANLFQL